ncbi:MAG: hypothetical protein AAF203_10800, partial [Pseudomonadota bacterium]
GLGFREVDDQAPFYLGVRCETIDGQLRVHLTFPKEVEIGETTLFDVMGKGEPYRVYDIEKISASTLIVGGFEFLYKKKSYRYQLISLAAETREEQIPPATFLIGLGYGDLSLTTVGVDASFTNYLLMLRLLPQFLWGRFGFGANAEGTLLGASGEDEDSLSYTQISAYSFYEIDFTDWWSFQPRLLFSFSEQVSGTGIDYRANNLGAGFSTRLKLSKRWHVILEGMTSALGSPIIDSHQLVAFTLFWRDRDSNAGWGLQAQMQDYSVVDEAGSIRDFSQTLFSLQRSF